MQNFVERDTETLIDTQLRNLGWIDSPSDIKRNVWKQSVKTRNQRAALGGKIPDYVLYQTDTDRPIIVIEAKRPYGSVEKALAQGEDYCRRLNAPICFATDGIYVKTRHIESQQPLFKDGEEIDEFIRETIALQYIQQETNEIRTLDRRVIQSRKELIQIFEIANNLLRGEGLQAGLERFSEFANILFLKLISELEDIKESAGEQTVIEPEFRWNFFKNKYGAELLHYVNDTVLRSFSQSYDDRTIFESLQLRNPNTLRRIIDILDPLNLTDVNSDIKGDAFEYFLRRYISSHNNDLGEYFTPRHIVKTCVKLANPQIGETVYDPFCGTGGMLIESFRHINSKMIRNSRNARVLKDDSLFGHEITNNARIAKMNMILMGDGHNNITRCDSLEKLDQIKEKYDVVITNMPFSQDTEYGNLYDLPSRNGNSICIQHCLKAIDSKSESGRIVLICGDDVLVSNRYERLREYIFKNSTVHTVVSLPPGVFAPYSNTVKTNILYLTNIKHGSQQEKYWYFKVKKDGYTFARNRRRVKHGTNDLDTFLMYRFSGDHELFKEVDIEDIRPNGYKMIPFLSSGLGSENAVLLGEITTQQFRKAGADFKNYVVGTVAARARDHGGVIPKLDYYKKAFQSENRSGYKLVMPGEFVYRKEGADIGNFGWNRYSYPLAVSPIYVVFSIDQDRILHDYLFNVLRGEFFKEAASNLMVGVARASLSYQDFSRMEIPLPSLERQREIVALENQIREKVREISEVKEQIQDQLIDIYATS